MIQFIELREVSSDHRRTILEACRPMFPMTRLTAITAVGGSVLGNHYHKRMTEVFILVAGAVEFCHGEKTDAGEDILSSYGWRILQVPCATAVLVPPRVSHGFKILTPQAVILHAADKDFDPSDCYPVELF